MMRPGQHEISAPTLCAVTTGANRVQGFPSLTRRKFGTDSRTEKAARDRPMFRPDHDETANAITEVTRRGLFDELRIANVNWSGRLGESDFLGRLFDLTALPSRDNRYSDMAGDIFQHRERNWDWQDDWVFDDSRLNLLRCDDEVLLRFLCEMVHPIVRSDEAEATQLVEMFNRHLGVDGFEIVQRTTISGKPIFAARARGQSPPAITGEVRRIADALSSDQIFAQITRMETSVATDPALAIGSAKEFVETLCKGILTAKGEALAGNETLPQLVKRVRGVLGLEIDGATADTIKRTLSALATLTQGIAELRGQLGSGHGHHPSANRPDPSVARLAVGTATTLGVFLFDQYQESLARSSAGPA